MEYILLFCAALTSSFKGLICKRIGTENNSNKRIYLLNGGIFITASLTVLIYAALSGGLYVPSLLTVILSLAFSAVLLFTQITETYAMKIGSTSITILIYSVGLVLPIFYGSVFLSEEVSLLQLFGMLLVILALVFIIDPRKDKSFKAKWLVFSVLAALGSGTTAIIQKVHQNSYVKDELCVFLVLAFLFSSIISICSGTVVKDGNERASFDKNTLRFVLFSGVCIGALNVLNLFLAGRLPAIIQFPIYNIGSMILTGLGGKIFFGERMSRRKTFGFLAGCAAILMIGLG